MIEAGQFYVLSIGKRYVRSSQHLLTGNQLQHAEQHTSLDDAREWKKHVKKVYADEAKKPVRIWSVSVREVE